jgi:hypothetical protein
LEQVFGDKTDSFMQHVRDNAGRIDWGSYIEDLGKFESQVLFGMMLEKAVVNDAWTPLQMAPNQSYVRAAQQLEQAGFITQQLGDGARELSFTARGVEELVKKLNDKKPYGFPPAREIAEKPQSAVDAENAEISQIINDRLRELAIEHDIFMRHKQEIDDLRKTDPEFAAQYHRARRILGGEEFSQIDRIVIRKGMEEFFPDKDESFFAVLFALLEAKPKTSEAPTVTVDSVKETLRFFKQSQQLLDVIDDELGGSDDLDHRYRTQYELLVLQGTALAGRVKLLRGKIKEDADGIDFWGALYAEDLTKIQQYNRDVYELHQSVIGN